MPQLNMYDQVTSPTSGGNNTNLSSLAKLTGINSITDSANGLLTDLQDAKLRERRVEYFYDQMLLDTIKLGSENNVLLKYCKVITVPKGNAKFLLRRWGGLTEHTFPLSEGIPPKSDRMASESFEGTYCQYGRYMEFTDRVEFNLIDDTITHYTIEMGELAVKTAERLCREELEANAGVTYPASKQFSTLVIGDKFGIEDYRLQALKFARRLVKPLAGGNYVVICSPEHIYDLVNDPLVDTYMRYTQSAQPYVTGKPVDLFNIRFEETMLDDYAYGYTEMSNPGEFDTVSGNTVVHNVRLVLTKADGTTHYMNAVAGSTNTLATANTSAVIKRTEDEAYLKDGSYIPSLVKWDIAGFKEAVASATGNSSFYGVTDKTGAAVTVTNAQFADYTIRQLPTHRSFMFGDEFIAKTGIDGEMDAKFYVKQKGSAGVLDPIDQRQSIGFKINTLGFNTIRPEAMVQFISVPDHALDTYNEIIDELDIHYNPGKTNDPTYTAGNFNKKTTRAYR